MGKISGKEMGIGQAIRLLREEKNMSILDLSKKTGISASYIARIESGERKNPNYTLLEKLVNGFDVKMEKFLTMLHEGKQ